MKLRFVCIVLFLLSNISCLFSQTIRYVKTNGSGNGSSWANASNDLQAMINSSASNDEIWVAEGTYYPTRDETDSLNPVNPREKTFKMKSGVNVYGGFNSTGSPTFNQRNWGTYQTILSGDLSTPADSSDNAFHVVSMLFLTTATTLDGLVIERGCAIENTNNLYNQATSDFDLKNFGGGILMNNCFSTPVISHCTLVHNIALGGGAVMAFSSSPIIAESVFADNGFYGIGFITSGAPSNLYNAATVYVSGSSIPVLTNCTIVRNRECGSGVDVLLFSDGNGGSWEFNNCIIRPNPFTVALVNSQILRTKNCALQNVDTLTHFYDTTNLVLDPMFMDINNPIGADGKWMTADDGLQLQLVSPCVNRGENTLIASGITKDIAGSTRLVGNTVDMGAYETAATCATQYTTLDTEICNGDSVTFNGNTYYQTTTATDTFMASNGCDSIITLNLTVNEPTSSFIYDTICQGAVYAFGGLTISSSGIYNRTISNSANCDSVITLHLYVRPFLNVSVTQNGFDFSATNGFTSYQWLIDGSVIDNANSSSYTANAPGSYSLVVTDVHGCTDTSDAIILTGLGLQNPETDIRIQPNPTTEKVSITSIEIVNEIVVYNMLGEVMMVMKPSAKVFDIFLQQWAAGLYQVYIKTSKITAIRKLVKHQ